MEKANTVVSFVGMDVHKESIDVTVAEEGPRERSGTWVRSAAISKP